MVIQTPRLCSDVAFLPPQKDQPNAVTCSPVLGEDQIEDYKQDLAALKSAENNDLLAAQKSSADNSNNYLSTAAQTEAAQIFSPQIVGDIAVGAHNLVPPNLKLEKSAIVGGGKDTYVDTIASSDGTTLSKEALEKLVLGGPKAVEEMRRKLERMAQGQEWKLDVVDTPRGREYRAIIGGESEEGEKKEGVDREEGEGKGEERGSEEEYYREEL